jgi:hypothetical protein
MMLVIDGIDLHWLTTESPQTDMCAHAVVQVRIGERVILDSMPRWYSVSTGALHLLRTLFKDHTAEHPIADHLIPCCGHFMTIEDGVLLNIGCPNGLNWWVAHEAESVKLNFDGILYNVHPAEWVGAVTTFADAVAHFYSINAPKTPEQFDAEWYNAFWHEWRQLRAAAKAL